MASSSAPTADESSHRGASPSAATSTAGRFTAPTSLSPSRVDAFTSCPLAFRFSSIQKLPEPPAVVTTRGSVVHRGLELLFTHPAAERTAPLLDRCVDRALDEYQHHPDYALLGLDADAARRFADECHALAANYLRLEDPTTVREIGLELRLEAAVDDLVLRGVIDRLELDDDGRLVVTDYKTGRAPPPQYEQKRLGGVHFYAFLCEQVLGRRPDAIRLMYLKSGEIITATPSAQSTRFVTTRTRAVWRAVTTACERDDFRARPSGLCDSCGFRDWCPAFGGDPERAEVEAPERLRVAVAA